VFLTYEDPSAYNHAGHNKLCLCIHGPLSCSSTYQFF